MKKLGLLLMMSSLPVAMNAQTIVENTEDKYPNTFSSRSSDVEKFTKDSKEFNDWSISAGVGVPFVQSADLTSIKNGNGKTQFGYSYYLSVDKAINHAFGLKLQYDGGETRQGTIAYNDPIPVNASSERVAGAKTKFHAISLLGDVNFSNILRRIDNKSPFRWAIHGYGGIGTLAYTTYLNNKNGKGENFSTEGFQLGSIFFQAGTGVKYKLNRRIDFEGRVMYVVTGDDEFDGGGDSHESIINRTEDQFSDDLFNIQLGVTVKLGKHDSHLFWHDPMQEIYYRAGQAPDFKVCRNGDHDDDGVCDDWDRQLNTPRGARVDGAGVALDTDLDGIIDLYDECVTVPGPASNKGCPEAPKKPVEKVVAPAPVDTKVSVERINKEFEGIEFALNKDVIRSQSFGKLNNAAEIIKTLDRNVQYYVVGATDTRGSKEYNQKLSQRRANAVVKYLVDKGVPSYMLIPQGRGEDDLKYPECEPATDCPEWKNEANRRVFFEIKR